jgi:hypothetical protein
MVSVDAAMRNFLPVPQWMRFIKFLQENNQWLNQFRDLLRRHCGEFDILRLRSSPALVSERAACRTVLNTAANVH